MVKSREFYIIKDGKPTDAPLHEPILAAGDDAAVRSIGRAVAKRAGLTDDEIARLYAADRLDDDFKLRN